MSPRFLMMAGLSLALSLSLFATDVRWGYVTLSDHEDDYGLHCSVAFRQNFDVDFSVTRQGTQFVLESISSDLLFSGNVVQLEIGAVVSDATVRNQDSYFYHVFVDEFSNGEDYVKRNITTTGGSIYLGFVSTQVDYVVDNRAVAAGYPNPVYGWVELQVDSSGKVTLLGSALDLDGGPMIVGGGSASPEPSSALLLLLGAGVLGLRRRRKP